MWDDSSTRSEGSVAKEITDVLLPTGTQGHFLLESGYHGTLWLDLEPLFVEPTRLHRYTAELAARLTKYGIRAVCGPLVGGAFISEMVALHLNIDFYYSERVESGQDDGLYTARYRLPASIRDRLRGVPVAIVDDVINAGSATRATLADL